MKILKTAIILFFCLTPFSSFAQKTNALLDVFQRSFIDNIRYPQLLIDQCQPTVTVIKIDINAKGKVSGIYLSDSADSLFTREFNAKKSHINVSTLNRYAKANGLKNISLLMPLYYNLTSNICTTKDEKLSTLQNMLLFKGKDIHRKIILLSAIDYGIIINRDY